MTMYTVITVFNYGSILYFCRILQYLLDQAFGCTISYSPKVHTCTYFVNTEFDVTYLADQQCRPPLRTLHLGHISSLMLAWCKEGTVSQVLSY